MASTYSNLKIQLMATGENSGTWGNVTNANLGDAIEQALVETATVTFASANVTLTLSDSNSRQDARALRLNLTGTTAGARDLIVPAIQKPYIVNNGTADIITVKVSGQTGVAVPAARSMLLYNNGTDVVNALTHTPVSSGGTGINASGTAGNVLTSNGTAWTSAAPAAFDAGTVMLFAQTAAPTGWTKDTSNNNNSALRVVTGTASTGGSVDFTTAFASQTPSGSISSTTATNQAITPSGSISSTTATNQAITPSGSVSVTISSISGSAGNTTLSTPQIPSHSHTIPLGNNESDNTGAAARQGSVGPFSTSSVGGGGAHSHPFSFSSGSASGSFSGNSMTVTQNSHNHNFTGNSMTVTQNSHNHNFTGSAINLAVKYVDVIRATKN